MASSARACFTNALTPSAKASSETLGHREPATVTSKLTRNSKRFTSRSSNRPSYLLSAIFVRTICASTSSETPSARSPRNTSASKRVGIFGGVIEPVGCASARDDVVDVFDVFVASSSPEAFFSGPRSIAFLMRFSFCAGDKSSSLSFV